MKDWKVTKRWRVDINESVYEWHVLSVHKDWPGEIYEGSEGASIPSPRIDVYVVRK